MDQNMDGGTQGGGARVGGRYELGDLLGRGGMGSAEAEATAEAIAE